jgi:outer membrane protein assembly factor BamD
MAVPEGGTGVGVSIVSAPAADPNAVVKPVGNSNNAVPPTADKPAEAPEQVNEVGKPGSIPAAPMTASGDKKKKAPKTDQSDESSSRNKKKKGLKKLNPF